MVSLARAAERCPVTLCHHGSLASRLPGVWHGAGSGLICLGKGKSQGCGLRKKAG